MDAPQPPRIDRTAGPAGEGVATDRSREREQEEDQFVPVILKRTDEVRRHPDDVLEAAIREGKEQLERPLVSLSLSALGAGLILGFTAMAVATVHVALGGTLSDGALRIVVALVYPLGFVVCIMAGTELFTEHTATAVYPVLDRRARWPALLRLWVVVLAGNLVGAVAIAALLTAADAVVGAHDGYVKIGRNLVGFPALPLLASALLAGWLMAMGAWLICATPPALAQVISIYTVTFLIGLGRLHHSIAGAVEVFCALFTGSGEMSLADGAWFIALAAIGNLVGGSLFVAVLNYGAIRESRRADANRGDGPAAK